MNDIVLSKNEGLILKKLLSGIEDIIVDENNTIIKFKGNLVILTEGTQLFKSEGDIIQFANKIHLNPEINTVNNIYIEMESRRI